MRANHHFPVRASEWKVAIRPRRRGEIEKRLAKYYCSFGHQSLLSQKIAASRLIPNLELGSCRHRVSLLILDAPSILPTEVSTRRKSVHFCMHISIRPAWVNG